MEDANASSGADGTNYVKVKLDPPPGFEFHFEGLEGTEELGRPFLYHLDLSSDTPKGDLTAILGATATITIAGATSSGPKRYINGYITRAVFAGMSGGAYRYQFELRPWIWLLSQTQNCRIFQNKSAFTIITDLAREAGFTDFEDRRQTQAGDQSLEYCVQYRETAFDFMTRLMELWGIYYFYEHSDGTHKLIFADDPNSHQSVGKAIPFRIKEAEARQVDNHIWQWASELNFRSGSYVLRDYNFQNSDADLTTKSIQPEQHPHASFEVFDYPGPYQDTGVGSKLAAVRMQDIRSRVQIRSGITNHRVLATGAKFTLSDFIDTSQNAEHLVIAATYQISAAEGRSETGGQLMDTYRCSFQAIPGTIPFKLDCQTLKPLVQGPQTARVVGESGEEVTTDAFGRIKVSFYWDRLSMKNETSSCFIRVAQIWAGASWGAIFIPRIGQEVLVEFLEGDPDRPIITGSVYNDKQTVPYPLADNKTRSTIKTNSSKGGGGFNELRFEDLKGSEEVFFQAQKDYNKVVLNNETVKITQDTTTTVDKGNRSVTLNTGNDTLKVSQGNHEITVTTGNDTLTVSTGNHSIKVSAGTSTIEAAQSITLKVGGNSIVIDTTGVTIKGTMINATANASMSLDGGGSMTVKAGMVAIN